MKLLNSRKGAMQMIFAWLFGILAGAALIVFFIRFASEYVGGEQQLEERKLVVFLDDKLDAFGIREGSDRISLNEDFSLRFDCGGVSLGSYRRRTENTIFSPPNLNGNTIYGWTKYWRFPYKSATFYYLHNAKSRTLLVYGPDTFDAVTDLSEDIPEIFNIQITGRQFFVPQAYLSQVSGLDSFVIVFFGQAAANPQDLLQLYRNTEHVEIITVDLDQHTARIHTRQGTTDVHYLGEEELYGLFFGGHNFECTTQGAREKLRTMTDIYLGKVERLMGKTNDQQCVTLLNEARKTLDIYLSAEQKTVLYDLEEDIALQNKKLAQSSCPTIY